MTFKHPPVESSVSAERGFDRLSNSPIDAFIDLATSDYVGSRIKRNHEETMKLLDSFILSIGPNEDVNKQILE